MTLLLDSLPAGGRALPAVCEEIWAKFPVFRTGECLVPAGETRTERIVAVSSVKKNSQSSWKFVPRRRRLGSRESSD